MAAMGSGIGDGSGSATVEGSRNASGNGRGATGTIFQSAWFSGTRDWNSSNENTGAEPVTRLDGVCGICTRKIASISLLSCCSYAVKVRCVPLAPTISSRSSPAA